MKCHFDHFHVLTDYLQELEFYVSTQESLENLWKGLEVAVRVYLESSCCEDWQNRFSWGCGSLIKIFEK